MRHLFLLVAVIILAACHSQTVRVSRAPTPSSAQRLNARSPAEGTAVLIDDRRVAGSNWQLDTEFLSYLVDNSTRHQIPINEVRYIDFPLSGGEAALLGSWRGALIGAPIGALVGLLIWKGGSSCSPEPCTPRDVGGAENILIGALGFGGLGAVLAGGIGLANGGRLRFRFNP